MCETAAEEDGVEDRIGPVDSVNDALWPHIFQRLDKPRGWLGTRGRLEPLWSADPTPALVSSQNAFASNS